MQIYVTFSIIRNKFFSLLPQKVIKLSKFVNFQVWIPATGRNFFRNPSDVLEIKYPSFWKYDTFLDLYHRVQKKPVTRTSFFIFENFQNLICKVKNLFQKSVTSRYVSYDILHTFVSKNKNFLKSRSRKSRFIVFHFLQIPATISFKKLVSARFCIIGELQQLAMWYIFFHDCQNSLGS